MLFRLGNLVVVKTITGQKTFLMNNNL